MPLTREELHRGCGFFTFWNLTDGDLVVCRHPQVDAVTVRNEQLFVRGGVVPPHFAGLLDLKLAALGEFLAENGAFELLRKISSEVPHAVVSRLQRCSNLLRA